MSNFILNEFLMNTKYTNFTYIPCRDQSKVPALTDWPNITKAEADRACTEHNGTNIAVLTGSASDNLVDIDLDSIEAVRLARYFLPPTGCIFGRTSKPESHFLYRAIDAGNGKALKDPETGATIVEYRADRQCTMVPPSTHPSGEKVEFSRSEAIASIDKIDLMNSVHKLAAASLLCTKWQEGSRHHLATALAGTLAHAGWEEQDAAHFIEAICMVSEDDELDDRLIAVESSFKRMRQGHEITGLPTLATIIGDKSSNALNEWLSLNQNVPANHSIESVAEDENIQFTDLWNTKLFAHSKGDEYCYRPDLATWMHWTGVKWEAVDKALLQKSVQGFVAKLDQLFPKNWDSKQHMEAYDWMRKSNSSRAISAIVKEAGAAMATTVAQWKANPTTINCNGLLVDLEAGEQFPCPPSYYLDQATTASPTSDDECPNFHRLLDHLTCGDNDLKLYLQASVGYSLTGLTSEQCLFVLHGEGANGKSTFLNFLTRLLGDYAHTANFNSFAERRGTDSNTNDLAHLMGKRVIVASESERGARISATRLKGLTGGDEINSRRLYQREETKFVNIGKIWMATNHLPIIDGGDYAMARRFRIIPITSVLKDEDRDPQLQDKLSAEMGAVMKWAIDGARMWFENGRRLPDCAIVDEATSSFTKRCDSVQAFIDEHISHKVGASATVKDVKDLYEEYCRGQRLDQDNTRLKSKLEDMGCVQSRTSAARNWKHCELTI